MKRIIRVIAVILLLALVPVLPQTVSAARLTNFNIRLDEPIASYTPDFSAEFNTNATMYTTVTWQENSPGFSAKLNSSDEFRAGLAYKVEIWIRLGEDNYFPVDGYGDLATAITVNGKAISSLKIEERNAQNQIVEVTITCNYDPLPGREISSVLVKGVPTPVAGNMPGYSFTVDSTAYGLYNTEPIVWTDKSNNSKQLNSSDKFIQGHVYQVSIWLYANREGGFTFKTDQNGNPQVSATINSWAADKVLKAYEQDGREVIELLYTFPACPAAHTCTPKLVPLQKQTCVLPGFKAYYECACGKCYEDAAGKKLITDMDGYGIIPADGHKEGAWSYDGTHHYKKCTTCKEVIPGTDAAHSGGTASCIQKAICAACGFAYGDTDSDHKWSPTYLYKDSKGHARVCADCKTHDTVKPHNPGPAATQNVPQTCKDCGYVISPALNHTHELTLVAEVSPTCMEPGANAHYTCNGCSELFKDENAKETFASGDDLIIPPQGHKISNGWKFDKNTHWRVCAACDEKMIETDMEHELKDDKCITCEYDKNKPEETVPKETEPKETKPNSSQKDSNSDSEPEGLQWWVVLLIGLGCAAIGVVIGVVVMQHTKKKK